MGLFLFHLTIVSISSFVALLHVSTGFDLSRNLIIFYSSLFYDALVNHTRNRKSKSFFVRSCACVALSTYFIILVSSLLVLMNITSIDMNSDAWIYRSSENLLIDFRLELPFALEVVLFLPIVLTLTEIFSRR